MSELQKEKTAVAWLSVFSNSGLVVLKLSTGLYIGSIAVISEAIHSGVDLLASLMALVSVKTSGQPPDTKHAFGHEKIENITGSLEALLILAAAAWIVYESLGALVNPRPVSQPAIGIIVMGVCIIVNLAVSKRLFQVGSAAESLALEGNAWHLRTDVYTSVGVMASLSLIMAAHWLFPGKNPYWIDPAAAIVVAAVIAHAGWKLLMKAVRDLLDARLPDDEEAAMKRLIAARRPCVHGFHQLRSRRAGQVRFVEFHLKVAADMTVYRSHALAEQVKEDIGHAFPGTDVSVHVEPCPDGCRGESCPEGCFTFTRSIAPRE